MSEQMSIAFDLGMVDEPRARRSDPVTSHQAAASAKELAQQHHILILGALMAGPAGVDRIAATTRLTSYQVSKRMSELERAGAARPTGKTVQSTAGRAQREWERA
jgi:predicted ArsR family transcriptional regulator